jgi:hypothetical protein
VSAEVVLAEGAYRLERVCLEPPEDGELSAGDGEAIPLAGIIDAAVANGVLTWSAGFLSEDEDEREAELEALLRAALGARQETAAATATASRARRRQYRLDNEHLARVAAIYAEAVDAGRRPVQAVADAFPTSRSTAEKWIARAREAGILTTPAPRGRPRGS